MRGERDEPISVLSGDGFGLAAEGASHRHLGAAFSPPPDRAVDIALQDRVVREHGGEGQRIGARDNCSGDNEGGGKDGGFHDYSSTEMAAINGIWSPFAETMSMAAMLFSGCGFCHRQR